MQYGPYNPPPGQPPAWQPQPQVPPGYPPQPVPPAQQAPAPKKAGCLMPVIWMILAFLGTLIAAAGVGIAAYNSESAGVQATQIAAIPFGFVWGGALAAAIIQLFWKKASTAVRVAGPIGCGCLGAIVFVGLVVVFFAAIFPSL
jgi:hypothetical protein